MLLFGPPYCRCHNDSGFRFPGGHVVVYSAVTMVANDDFRCGELAMTSRFLWLAPYTDEISDADTSKNCPWLLLDENDRTSG
jgi:hypothetical protein